METKFDARSCVPSTLFLVLEHSVDFLSFSLAIGGVVCGRFPPLRVVQHGSIDRVHGMTVSWGGCRYLTGSSVRPSLRYLPKRGRNLPFAEKVENMGSLDTWGSICRTSFPVRAYQLRAFFLFVFYNQLRTRKKVSEEVELVDMRPPGVGSIEVESPVEDAREVVLDQPSKVKRDISSPPRPPARPPARPSTTKMFVSVVFFVNGPVAAQVSAERKGVDFGFVRSRRLSSLLPITVLLLSHRLVTCILRLGPR